MELLIARILSVLLAVHNISGTIPLETTHCVVRKRQDSSGNEYEYYHGTLITHYNILCHADIITNQHLSRWSILASPVRIGTYFKRVTKISKGIGIAVLEVDTPGFDYNSHLEILDHPDSLKDNEVQPGTVIVLYCFSNPRAWKGGYNSKQFQTAAVGDNGDLFTLLDFTGHNTGCIGAPAYSQEDDEVVGFCSYSETFDNMYVCVKVRSVFDSFIREKIRLSVPGETCNVPPRPAVPSSLDEAEGSRGRRLDRQPSCGFSFFSKKRNN